MPNHFPAWYAVYRQSQRWLAEGCFEMLAQDLRARRTASGSAGERTAAIIGNGSLRSTPESGTRAGYDGAKRKRGSTVHMPVYTLVHLLSFQVTPPDVGDRVALSGLPSIPRRQQATASSSHTSTRFTRGKPAPMLPRPRGSNCTSSSCPRPSEVPCFSHNDGSWSDSSHGQRAAVGWSSTTSDTPQASQDSISSRWSDKCSTGSRPHAKCITPTRGFLLGPVMKRDIEGLNGRQSFVCRSV